jgi:hypothetical protein
LGSNTAQPDQIASILWDNPMPKFRQHLTWLGPAIIAITLATACSLSRKGNAPSTIAQFDNKPETVVIYADIHYPGIPEPTKTPNDRYCPYLPSMRVWGDGFAYLDENILNEYNSVLSGKLDSSTLQRLFDILSSENFFTTWQVSGPNPAGTMLKIGAQLKDKPVTEYTSGDLGPRVYVRLIETIKPALKPLAEQSAVDERVLAVLKENENCNKYLYNK